MREGPRATRLEGTSRPAGDSKVHVHAGLDGDWARTKLRSNSGLARFEPIVEIIFDPQHDSQENKACWRAGKSQVLCVRHPPNLGAEYRLYSDRVIIM
jgi:hypothetical protein